MKPLLLKTQIVFFIVCLVCMPMFDVLAQDNLLLPQLDGYTAPGAPDDNDTRNQDYYDTWTGNPGDEIEDAFDPNDPFGLGTDEGDPFDQAFLEGGEDFEPGVAIGEPAPQAYLGEDGVWRDQSGNVLDITATDDLNNILEGDGGGTTGDAAYLASAGEYSRALSAVNSSTATGRTTQAQAYASGNSGTTAATGAKAQPGSAGACVASQLLGKILTSTITSAIGKVVSNLLGREVAMVRGAVFGVPSNEIGATRYEVTKTKEQITLKNQAEIGTSVGLGGVTDIMAPGWNAVGYCIVNSMIDYIARSTIAWARSGFQGNPAFIDNPGQFFKQLANIEAGAFLQTLAYGALGQNICQPFRAQIVLTIARDYLGVNGGYGGVGAYGAGGYGGGGGYNTFGGCTLDDIKGNFKGFLKGNFDQGGWNSWIQVSQVQSNNPYTTYLTLSAQLQGSINKKKQIANTELGWGRGFLSFRKCDEKVAPKDRDKCPITTPGNIIQSQLEKTLNLPKDRLVLAEKFDQVIAEVVNALIQTALSKVLD